MNHKKISRNDGQFLTCLKKRLRFFYASQKDKCADGRTKKPDLFRKNGNFLDCACTQTAQKINKNTKKIQEIFPTDANVEVHPLGDFLDYRAFSFTCLNNNFVVLFRFCLFFQRKIVFTHLWHWQCSGKHTPAACLLCPIKRTNSIDSMHNNNENPTTIPTTIELLLFVFCT